LLIEEARTNLLFRSQEFDSVIWIKSGSTVTANSANSPDATTTADLLVEDFGLSSHVVQQSIASSLAAGQPYTLSVFAKAASHTSFQILPSTTAFASALFANFLLTGSGSVGASNGVTASIQPFPNGWYKCSVTVSSVTGGIGGFAVFLANNNNSNAARAISYQGNGAQAVYLWGAQLEAGFFPTSYIPTAAASVVRSADVCSITGSDFSGMWQSATAATILLEANASAMAASTSGNRGIATLSNGAAYSNQIGFYKESGTNFIRGRTPTGNLIQVSNLLGKFKGAIAIDSSTAGCFNGGTVITGSGNIGTVDRLSFADSTLVPAGHPSVWISRYQIYRKRLPDAKLQSLTS
jgi:hypothetical protein